MLKNILKSPKNFFLPYLLIIVIMVAFNFINYQYMLRSIRSQSVSSTMSEINNSTLALSNSQNDILQFINEIDTDTSIFNLSKNPETSLLEVRHLSKRLNISRNSMPIVDNIIIYFKNSDIAVDCTSSYYLNNKGGMISSDSLNFDELKSTYFNSAYHNTFVEIDDMVYFDNHYTKTYGLISSLPTDYDNPTIQIAAILNNYQLYDIIAPAHRIKGAVYDLLSDNHMLMFNPDIDPEVFESVDNYGIKRINGKKHIIYNSPINGTPWRLVAAIPYSEVAKAATYQKTIVYITLVLSIILCILFGINSAKNSKRRFDSIIETNRSQHKRLSEYTPHIQNESIRKLLLGEADIAETLYFNEKYDLIPKAKNYCVLRFNIKTDTTSEVNFAKEMKLKKFVIKNVIEEIYQNSIYVNTGLDNICFILYSDKTESSFRQDFDRICEVIENVLINTVNYNLSYSLGTIVHNFNEFCESFFEAVNSIMLKELSSQKEINADGVFFPLEFETALISAVRHGTARTIHSIFDVLKAVNTENEDTLLDYLRVCLNRAAEERSLPDGIALNAIDDYKQAFITLAERGSSNASVLFNNILAYVRENFSDPQLSRKLLSDKFNISEEYVSMLFKKNFDITFLNYVEKMRIDHACELISGSDGLNLEEIAAKCGYITSASFRRAFKKVTGVLPSQYKNI